MTDYTVHTDLDPEALSVLAAETYRQWLEFALGKGSIGGKTLQHPSGAYAASISWRKTGTASIAIIADETKAPEAKWIEDGHEPYGDLKDVMLAGQPTSKDGYRYRVVPISDDAPTPAFDMTKIVSNASGERIPTGTARLWARAKSNVKTSNFRMMTDKPGSADWLLPDMPAYSPAYILSELIRSAHGVE